MTKNYKEMIADWLLSNGYDGLWNGFDECSCEPGDMVPCDFISIECEPGYKIPCDCGDCDYHIGMNIRRDSGKRQKTDGVAGVGNGNRVEEG